MSSPILISTALFSNVSLVVVSPNYIGCSHFMLHKSHLSDTAKKAATSAEKLIAKLNLNLNNVRPSNMTDQQMLDTKSKMERVFSITDSTKENAICFENMYSSEVVNIDKRFVDAFKLKTVKGSPTAPCSFSFNGLEMAGWIAPMVFP